MDFIKKAGALFFGRLASACLVILIGGLSTRLMTTEEYGAIVATLAAIALMIRVTSLGLGQAAQYFAAKNIDSLNSPINLISVLTLIVALVVTVSLYSAHESFVQVFLGEMPLAKSYFSILWYNVPIGLITFIALLFSLGRKEVSVNLKISIYPLLISLGILTWAELNDKNSSWVIFSWQAQYLVSFVLSIFYLYKLTTKSKNLTCKNPQQVIAYAGSSYILFIVSYFQNKIGLLTGIWFTNATELAFFSVANTFAESLMLFYGAIGPLAFSYTGRMTEKTEKHFFISKLSRRLIILLLIISCIVALLTPTLMPIVFGNKYVDAYTITWCILPSVVFAASQRTLENYLYGINKQGFLMYLYLINIIGTLLLSFALTPIYGAYGIAASAVFSQFLSYVFTLYLCWSVDRLNPKNLLIPKKEDFIWFVNSGRKLYKKMVAI